ncbi:unnamed protein product [Rotaria sordida]|uniref:RAP domain-containing protein n=1 Tax=Rotaria sordida TaxID=392033 RepID=A0A814B9K2_9BILA|nr:unnamed protein product [Rotaria sordida]CAF0923985.1 unnamed protein product [Rotaria sordida]CAF3599157.1 unnamed protein product [Rotaria sordida]
MLRFLGSYSRTVLSSYPSTANILLKSIRSVSNNPKIAQSQPSNDKSTSRQLPSSVTRKVDVKRLFSNEESEEIPIPTSPRRPNILHSSSFEDPLRLTSNVSIKNRYENEISNINDYEAEEQRRYLARQTQIKMQSKRKISTNKINIETVFDNSKNISTEKKIKIDNIDKSNLQKPRQPKKERSLTKQSDESSNPNELQRQRSDPMLAANIKEANTVEDLMTIFDKYIVPTEFALGLQKMCQLASIENSNAIHIYAQSYNARNRMESLLISFLGKFSDHEILTAITFVTKYYPEDNEFTDKFSLTLANRLRRISVHQIVRILEELKSSRHTTQWIHRIYNRLLALAEGRYFEFDNIRDILALTYKLSYNDRLINRLDERILEISDTLTFDDWFKILINKSILKRRDRTIIRAACYHLLKLSESFLFPLDKIKDCLFACAMLNVYEKSFLERLIRDAYEQINNINDQFIFQSIVTSMGTLRLRHCELLDAFGRIVLEESNLFSSLKNKSIQSFIRTCASVNYSPSILSKIIENYLKFDENITDDNNQLNEIKNRIDLVWSLAILDQANQNHLSIVLNQDIFQLVQNEISNSKIASALKLLTTYSYSLQKFSKKFPKPTFNIEQLAQQLTVKNSNAQDQLAKTVITFAAENKYSKFNVVTSNMIVIDCLMVVDKTGIPQDLNTVLTNGDGNGQTTFNKIRIDENNFKIALKCLDYQDKTLLTKSVSGSIALQLRLLNSLGYKCVPIDYDEFIKIQVINDRSKYIQRKIKEAISSSSSSSSTLDDQINVPATQKKNENV